MCTGRAEEGIWRTDSRTEFYTTRTLAREEGRRVQGETVADSCMWKGKNRDAQGTANYSKFLGQKLHWTKWSETGLDR